jgi:serine/threonine-protein kinase
VARIEAALHPEFVSLLAHDQGTSAFVALATTPAGHILPALLANSKVITLSRVLGKPLEVPQTDSGWLREQLPQIEAALLRTERLELLIPIVLAPGAREALLVLGPKRSEEPYSREDKDLLESIASSLALLLEKPSEIPVGVSVPFQESAEGDTISESNDDSSAPSKSGPIPVRIPRLLVGRYRLEKRCGQGGMGTVYEATDMALERRVAVKVIRDDLVSSAKTAERFRLEARATANFSHPNVVTVYDFGVVAETRAFLVMEFLEGRSLRDELRTAKQLTTSRTLGILRGVCAAIEAAHRRRLVHRDLKPENIFLSRGETGEVPKILDFGIAKFLPSGGQATTTTESAAILGTLPYMAPEQLNSQPMDPSWDIWALAVVSYEMLCGAHPFAGVTGADYSALLVGRFTPLARHLPQSPPKWQGFFERALALQPLLRPKTATALFSELEQVLA